MFKKVYITYGTKTILAIFLKELVKQMISTAEIIDINSLLFNLSQSPLNIFHDKIERPCPVRCVAPENVSRSRSTLSWSSF